MKKPTLEMRKEASARMQKFYEIAGNERELERVTGIGRNKTRRKLLSHAWTALEVFFIMNYPFPEPYNIRHDTE